jgi:hypothetical protein
MKQAANRAEDTNLHSRRCENLKPNIKNCFRFVFILHISSILHVIFYIYYIYLTDFLQLLPHYCDSDKMTNPEIINFVVKTNFRHGNYVDICRIEN